MEISAAIGPLESLIRQRDRLLVEMEALRNQIAGLDMAIKLISDAPDLAPVAARGKVHVSETIISLLRESGENGLRPKTTIELAARRGIHLNRGSVYSLLNRMEHTGRVVREDSCYKLIEFSRRRDLASPFVNADQPLAVNKH